MAIEIVAVEEETRRYWLRVDINAAGDLVLEGQDLSPGLEAMFGRDEYEYWYTVKAADIAALLASLGEPATPHEAAPIASLLHERFAKAHGITTSTAFKNWCKEHAVPFAFSSY